uniref:Uncharacterized protein n=1 Tax=Rheinheimera sp. BAL341 TaxID=1708203 RepID=A0A486XTV7_9GAMM
MSLPVGQRDFVACHNVVHLLYNSVSLIIRGSGSNNFRLLCGASLVF